MHKLLNLDLIYFVPILLSAISSLVTLRRKWPKLFRIFSIFLWTTVLVEAFVIAWVKLGLHTFFGHNNHSHSIYNLFIPVRHLFLLYFFYNILYSSLIRKVIRGSVIPVIVFALVNYTFIETPYVPNSYTIIITNLITILLCLAFFYQILKEDEIINLSASAEVWIVSGTFLYYAVTLPLFIVFFFLMEINLQLLRIFFGINDVMNFIMYTSYIIAFLCKPPSLK